MRTRLTDLLDVEHPIMLAGMGGVSYHRLVAAVREAGGSGTRGASTMSVTELPEEMAMVRELTAKPFGVDLLTAMPGQVEQGIRDVIAGGACIFVAGLGVPRDAIDARHDASVLVGSACAKVRPTGAVATMALVPQVVDAVGEQGPVVAAGELYDGRVPRPKPAPSTATRRRCWRPRRTGPSCRRPSRAGVRVVQGRRQPPRLARGHGRRAGRPDHGRGRAGPVPRLRRPDVAVTD